MEIDSLSVVGVNKSEGRYEVMIEEALDDAELEAIIYEKYDGPRMDFGGGVTAINCGQFLEYYEESPHKIARALGIKVKQAKEVVEACQKTIREQEVY